MTVQWDNTINVGQIGTLGVFLITSVVALMKMHGAVVTMKIGLDTLDARQAKTEMQLAKQTDLLVSLAKVEEWRGGMERRVTRIEDHDSRISESQRRRALEQVIESEARVARL